jgi:hypothetical protein
MAYLPLPGNYRVCVSVVGLGKSSAAQEITDTKEDSLGGARGLMFLCAPFPPSDTDDVTVRVSLSVWPCRDQPIHRALKLHFKPPDNAMIPRKPRSPRGRTQGPRNLTTRERELLSMQRPPSEYDPSYSPPRKPAALVHGPTQAYELVGFGHPMPSAGTAQTGQSV